MKKKKRYGSTKSLSPEQIARVEDKTLALAERCKAESEFVLDPVMEEEQGRWFLRVYLDQNDPSRLVTLEDCQRFSQCLDPLLDENVPELNDFPYALEISSPGLFRALRKSREFQFYKGRRIEIAEKGKTPMLAILDGFNPETSELTYHVPLESETRQLVVSSRHTVALAPEVKAIEDLQEDTKEEITHD